MKPFRTNKKDRETFAKMMGWTSTTRAIYSNDKTGIFRGINVNMSGNKTWQFCDNGFQRTIARLHELGWHPFFIHDPLNGKDKRTVLAKSNGESYWQGRGKSVGESLFRAVVAMGEAHHGQR